MMLAPTNEIAIGMKMSDLGIDSRLIRSSSRASIRPRPVEKSGAMMIHSDGVDAGTCALSGSVKIHA